MKQTKEELLIGGILKACESITKEPLTEKEKESLKEFIAFRLRLHGRSGYLFHTAQFYKRVYIPTNTDGELELIAEYVLKCNHKQTNKRERREEKDKDKGRGL